jgi:hypothetical protein
MSSVGVKRVLRWLSVPALATGMLVSAAPANAQTVYPANRWAPHPPLNSDWHCQKVVTNGTYVSMDACVIWTPNMWQLAIAAGNRTDRTRTLSAQGVATVNGTRVNWSCGGSGVAANSYSVCFGPGASGSSSGYYKYAFVIDGYSTRVFDGGDILLNGLTYTAPPAPLHN